MKEIKEIKEYMDNNKVYGGDEEDMRQVLEYFIHSVVRPLSIGSFNEILTQFKDELEVKGVGDILLKNDIYYLCHKNEEYPLFKTLKEGGLVNLKAIFAVYRKIALIKNVNYDGRIPLRFTFLHYYKIRLCL